jgi:tRNA(fMet)-specific endonuclease VapC
MGQRRAEHAADLVTVTIISVEEQFTGWYSLLRRPQPPERLAAVYQRMTDAMIFLAGLPIVTFREAAILRFEQLRAMRLNVGTMDLRIAAIALEEGAVVVTRNIRDFGRIPNLEIEDWSITD